MTPLLVGLVLTAAVLHAVWNAMAKSGGTPELSIASYQLVGRTRHDYVDQDIGIRLFDEGCM